MAGRRAARRTALFLLYQWDLTAKPLASLYEGEVDPFALETARAVSERADELDSMKITLKENISLGRVVRIEAHEPGRHDRARRRGPAIPTSRPPRRLRRTGGGERAVPPPARAAR